MSINWVMLSPGGNPPFTPLPNETTIFTSSPRVGLTLTSPTHYPGKQQKLFSLSSPSGLVYLTSRRVIYIPDKASDRLQSFTAPLLNLHDSHVTAPFFGPNVWIAMLQPVSGGGIDAPAVEAKLTFKDGGAFDFQTSFERVIERLQQVVDVTRMEGNNNEAHLRNVDLEELPAYQEESSGPLISPVRTPSLPENSVSGSGQNESHAAPSEPPPGYEEAQRTR